MDGRCGKHVLLQRIRPYQTIGGNVAGSSWVDAFEPGFRFSPPEIAAASDIKAIVMKNRHAVKIAWAFAAVAVEPVNVGFRSFGIEIELPNGVQRERRIGLLEGWSVGKSFEGVNDPIARSEKDQVPAIRFA